MFGVWTHLCITASRSAKADFSSLDGNVESDFGDDRMETLPNEVPFLLRGVIVLKLTSMLAI